jgi:hypothetical protein
MPNEQSINALVERLEADGELSEALEADPFTALRELGFDELAATVEQERDRIGKLLDRIYEDESFRSAVEQDPITELTGWGLPELAIAPVLVLAGAPGEVVERATEDVEAHILGRKPMTVAALGAMLGAFAFAQQASAASQPDTASVQIAPAAHVQLAPAAEPQLSPAARLQVSPDARVQVSAAAKTQLSPADKPQVSKAATATWQGVRPDRLKAQARLASVLRAQGIGR